MNNQPPTITVVNIMSVSFSGSTWLNLMLGSTDDSFSIGEMKRVINQGQALCTIHGQECPLWSRFEYPSQENPFQQLSQLTGKRVLITNNSRNFFQFQNEPQIKPKFIHLVRDGRAVAASFMRKFPNRSILRAAHWWAKCARHNRRVISREPQSQCLLVHYEKLYTETNAQLQRICDFIGMTYDPGMADYWNSEHHFMGGNRGSLLAMINKNRDKPVELPDVPNNSSTPKWDMEYYKNSDPSKFTDERWKSQLSNRQLRLFGLVAGHLNRQFGYSSSLDRESFVRCD